MRYISEKEAIAINSAIIKRLSPSEQIGVKDPSLLNSAVNRPKASAFENDIYQTLFEKAAALFESLAQNHPFQNGNKRTAFIAMVIFLKKNGFNFKMDQAQAEDFTVNVVNKKYSFNKISAIIEESVKRIN